MKFILPMFPYPSGSLHLGHLRVYSISDALARFSRAKGSKVLHPIGWDAFGLPAENAARMKGIDPETWTVQNIKKMRLQLMEMDLSFDWDREINTSHPSYYTHTQWLFLKLYQSGLVSYRSQMVDWDPVDKTVISNEQCIHGKAERSGALVIKTLRKEWFVHTTAFASLLVKGLKNLDWPESVKNKQRAWINLQGGYVFHAKVAEFDDNTIEIFIGESAVVSYLSIGPDHPILKYIGGNDASLFCDVLRNQRFISIEEGFFTGSHVEINGKKIPIWIAGYMSNYATECHAGIPNESPLHRKFADKNNIDIIQDSINKRTSTINLHQKYTSSMRDWLVSRQRRWGTPIPMIHCTKCGIVPESLVKLPVIISHKAPDFNCKCPKCQGEALRDSNVMDTFMDSSWYWLRYHSPRSKILDTQSRVAVDLYIGGVEHSIMHLIYSRFMAKFLCKIGIITLPNDEPFTKLISQGLVVAKTYKCRITDEYQSGPSNSTTMSISKMSKSKLNGVDPSPLIAKWGSDVVRMYILYPADIQDNIVWDEKGLIGMKRFLMRVEKLVESCVHNSKNGTELSKETVECILKTTSYWESSTKLHISITLLMKLSASMAKIGTSFADLDVLLRLLYPLAPQTAIKLLTKLHKRLYTEEEIKWPIII